jgi:nuclear pore complex protein Nup98-Nup96
MQLLDVARLLYLMGLINPQLYLDYANLIILLDQQAEEGPAVPDAVQATELARLTLELPKLIPLMPLIGGQNPALKHRAAVQQMATELLRRQTQMESLGLVSARYRG